MLGKNDDIRLFIEDYTSEGSGIGKYEGQIIFVPGTAVGDTVMCHIIKAKKNYAVGKCSGIITPSPDRTEIDCPVFSACGGCAFRHITYEAELRFKEKRVSDAFQRIGRISLKPENIIGAENITGYRNKAQYPVKKENGEIKIGFYAQKSHRITDGGECALQPEDFSQTASIFRKFIAENGISVYDEQTKKGLVRHLYLRKAFASDELMVCVVINGNALPHYEKLLESLKAVLSFRTLVLNINKEDTNVVLGQKCITLYGDGYITDELCSLRFKLSPLSFYQVNREQAQLLYGKVKELASCQNTDTVLDLYCGTGTIGLTLAKDIKQLIGVEIVSDAINDANENAGLNNIRNARFICADAADAAKTLETEGITPDTVILDPPRKGCEAELLKTVSKMKPKKIVYVSCDCATQARDCAILTEFGYSVKKIIPVDLFPRTAHVETVVLLSRDSK